MPSIQNKGAFFFFCAHTFAMDDFHICLLNWNMRALAASVPSLLENFGNRKFIVCSSDVKKTEGLLSEIPDKLVFSPSQLDSRLGREEYSRANSIGHCRNLMFLASACVSPSAPLVLLDDDIITSAQTRRAFQSAFSKYDLVQGLYEGASGNKIYALVYFFDLLSEGEGTPDFEERVKRALCGFSEIKREGRQPLSSMPGGLAGISGALKGRNCFAPTSYPFDDHFFEFSSRFLFPSLRFMPPDAAAGDIPVAVHNMAEGSDPDALVSNFVREVRSSIVESYFYFRLSGCAPRLVGGRHTLARVSGFDAGAAASEACRNAALEKFRQVASFHIARASSPLLQAQLERIINLSVEDFLVPIDELGEEWGFLEEERAWFGLAAKQCKASGAQLLEGIA